MNLKQAILLNAKSNPELAWQLFKRVASSSRVKTDQSIISCVPLITRVLLTSLQSNISHLTLLLRSNLEPFVSFVTTLAHHAPFQIAINHFKTLRSQFPDSTPPIYLYNVLIKSCMKEDCVDYITWLYRDMALSGVTPQTYTFNLLIAALCDSGRVTDGRQLFDKMSEKGCVANEFSLGILIRGYCKAEMPEKGLQFVQEAVKTGFQPNRVVYNTLISCFCRLGNLEMAETVTEKMREAGFAPNVVTFNSRISSLCRSGNVVKASRIFRDMLYEHGLDLPRPNIITYNLLLQGFFKGKMVEEAKNLIISMKEKGYLSQVETFNIWISGLIENNKLFEAQIVLDEMMGSGVQPSLYTYNILIHGLCTSFMISDARRLMGKMASSGFPPDIVTYSCLLRAYCRKRRVTDAINVLNEMNRKGVSLNSYICNILLRSLWEEGKVAEADDLLQQMKRKDCGIDIVTCNIVIGGLCSNGFLDRAVSLVNKLWIHGSAALGESEGNRVSDDKCVPNLITYSIVISALCKAGRVSEAKRAFSEMIRRKLFPDSAIFNCFIRAYCAQGKVSSAFRVLKDMEMKGFSKTIETYGSLIGGLAKKHQIFEIHGLLDEMAERGIDANVGIYNSLLSGLCESGRCEDTLQVLNEMLQRRIFPNVSSFRILLKAFCEARDFAAVREVFDIGVNVCGHEEGLYSSLFNQLVVGDETEEAVSVLESALGRNVDLKEFNYRDLTRRMCEDDKAHEAGELLRKMGEVLPGRLDAAAFVPVIEAFNKARRKLEANELTEMMTVSLAGKDGTGRDRSRMLKGGTDSGKPVLSDDGSGTALQILRRVQKAWGQETISTSQLINKRFVED